MRFTRNKTKWWFCAGLALATWTSCGKVTLESANKSSNTFNQDGREFIFASAGFTGAVNVYVKIPAGAVNGISYLEFYPYRLDDHNSINSYYVNDTFADINLLISDGNTLQKPATVQIPFYFAENFDPSSGYTPYHVTAADYTDLMEVLNNDANWRQITDFTYDNSSKRLIFQTYNLKGIYVVARHK